MPTDPYTAALDQVSNVVSGGFEAAEQKKNERRAQEYRSQQRNEDIIKTQNDRRQLQTRQDLAPDLTGTLSTDYLTGDMLAPTSRDQIGGGALETTLNLAGGYNPVTHVRPDMQVLGADRDALAGLKESAQANTERTLSGWEEAAQRQAQAYEDARQGISDRQDEMNTLYTDRLAEDRADEQSDINEGIINAWIESNDANGVLGDSRFIDARRGGRGKVLGADEEAKRQWIEDRLDRGYSYEDLVNDPYIRRFLQADPNSQGLMRIYEGERE